MGGFTGSQQHEEHQFYQGQSSMGGYTSGQHQEYQFFQGQSSMGGYTSGQQQQQFQGQSSVSDFHDSSSLGFDSSLQTPPPYDTQTQDFSAAQHQYYDPCLFPWHTPPRHSLQIHDTMPQEMANEQGKARGQQSQSPVIGFSGFASMSAPFLTPKQADEEAEEEEEPLRRRGPHRMLD